MQGVSTLEQIEADLQFCEDVLNSKTKPPPRRPASAGAFGGTAARTQHKQPLPLHRQQRQQQQPSQQQQQQQQGTPPRPAKPAALPAARTTDELLAMLSSVPAGQPFEIDTRLLYSPQSSCDDGSAAARGSRRGSPNASIDGGAAFSLPAYRASTDGQQPLFGDVGQAAAALSPQDRTRQAAAGQYDTGAAGLVSRGGESAWRSQQHAPGPPPSAQQQQAGGGQRPARSPGGIRGGDMRPASAPGRGPLSRQLQLDEALEHGVHGRTADLLRQGREDRLQQLAQPRTDLWQRCAHIRLQEEREQLQECTFAPQTGRPPARHRLAPGVPVEDRLTLSQAARAEALERARREKEREVLADCTFAPQLVTQPERLLAGQYTPPHRRLGEEARRRTTRLAQAALLHGLGDADLTFQPQLNPRSLQLAAEKEVRELYEEPGSARRPRSAPRSAGADERGCTFAPAINRASERLLEDSSTVPSDFQERLRYYSARRQAKERAAAAAADAEACTFRPDTGNAVQVLALSAQRAGNLLETEQERCERMAKEEAARLAARRAAIEAEVYGGLDFRPQINQRSRALAPAGSGGVEALASADKRRAKLERLQREEEARRRAECTFQPDTSKPRVKGYYDEYQPPTPGAALSIASAAKQGFEGLTQRIADLQAEKEARAAVARAEEEAARLRECTFAPDINRRRVEAKGPVVVRGLERVLELKQLAERQRVEAEERAAKVFHQRPKAKQGATVPQPFQLAGHALLEAKAADKQASLLQSTLAQRAQQCPFRPQTNYSARRDKLAQLLAQPSLSESELAGAFHG